MQPRPLDPQHDFPAVADLLGRTRASGGHSHPGGVQWWLRELASDRDDFEAFVWTDEHRIAAFALVDGTFVVIDRLGGGPTHLEQIEFLEQHVRDRGRDSLTTTVVEGDALQAELEERGYEKSSTELELMADTTTEPPTLPLPEGFRFASLHDVTDEAYIAGHRAAWSDTKPSSYSPERHESVKRMPQFRADLVTIALAPDGTVAACCIGWMDELSATLEIEPLGTHRDYRRLGLASAIVREVQHRAWASGAEQVLVWNHPEMNPKAYGLYTGAGMPPRRHLAELTRTV